MFIDEVSESLTEQKGHKRLEKLSLPSTASGISFISQFLPDF